MENKKEKPLRKAHNAAKDLYNAYKKNEERIIDIKDKEDMDKEEELEAKVMEAMQEEESVEETEPKSLLEEPVHDDKTDEEIHTLEGSIESYKSENDKLKEALARKTAEMENMRKRVEREKKDLIEYGNEKLLQKFLEIPDTMKQALEASEKSQDFDSLKQGLDLIYKKAEQLFTEAGVKPMLDLEGKEFDYEYHEALLHTPNDEVPENHIIQVVQNGFIFNDKVLRHAKVITSSGPNN